jgi:hypothetical protein
VDCEWCLCDRLFCVDCKWGLCDRQLCVVCECGLCDRQLCVNCQWCFIVEGTDCYCILYMLAVSAHKNVYPLTNS